MHGGAVGPLSFLKRGGSTRLRERGVSQKPADPIAWNCKFETAVGQTEDRAGSGYHLLQKCNTPELKGKQHFAFMRRRLYAIFKELWFHLLILRLTGERAWSITAILNHLIFIFLQTVVFLPLLKEKDLCKWLYDIPSHLESFSLLFQINQFALQEISTIILRLNRCSTVCSSRVAGFRYKVYVRKPETSMSHFCVLTLFVC